MSSSPRPSVDDFLRILTADRLGRDPGEGGAGAGATAIGLPAGATGRRTAAERRAASLRAARRLEELGC